MAHTHPESLLRRQHSFQRPAQRKTTLDRASVNSCDTGPLNQGASLTIKGNPAVIPLIPVLLLDRSPSAVFRRIRTIIVQSIQHSARERSFTHVCQENAKIVPLRANKDSSSAIPCIGRVVWVFASLNHSSPRGVFGSLLSVMPKFGLQTAATPSMLRCQRASFCDFGITAIATTEPLPAWSFGRRGGKHNQPPEPATDQVLPSLLGLFRVSQWVDSFMLEISIASHTIIPPFHKEANL